MLGMLAVGVGTLFFMVVAYLLGWCHGNDQAARTMIRRTREINATKRD